MNNSQHNNTGTFPQTPRPAPDPEINNIKKQPSSQDDPCDDREVANGYLQPENAKDQFHEEDVNNQINKAELGDLMDEQDPFQDWDFDLDSPMQLKEQNKQGEHTDQEEQTKLHQNSESPIEPLPNFSQIQNCVNMLVRIMPEVFTQDLISTFYHKLFLKLVPNSPNAPQQPMPQPEITKPAHKQTPQNLSSDHNPIKKESNDLAANEYLNSYSSIQDISKSIAPVVKTERAPNGIDRATLQKKIIVNAFCSGLGYNGIQPEIRKQSCLFQITEERYLAVMKQTIMDAYLYAKKLAGKRHKPAVKARPADLLRVLNNCKRTLSAFVCQIFLKALRQISIKKFDLSVDQALRLLKGIDQGLLKTNTNFSNSQKAPREIRNERYWKQKQKELRKSQKSDTEDRDTKFELHSRWTNDFEILLLRMYRQGAGFAQIRDHFQQEYPGQREMFSVVSIRSMFFKIMRMAVWKSGRKDLPPLVKMEDQLVKNIINCSQCLNLRKLLIDVYQCETACGRELLGKVICMINLYYESGGGFKKSQTKQRDMEI